MQYGVAQLGFTRDVQSIRFAELLYIANRHSKSTLFYFFKQVVIVNFIPHVLDGNVHTYVGHINFLSSRTL